MLRRATALYIFTGTLSSPKLIEPLHIALAMDGHLPGLFQSIPGPDESGLVTAAILRPAPLAAYELLTLWCELSEPVS
jgi:hypothetical protein